MQPRTSFHQHKSYNTLNQICKLRYEIKRHNRHHGKTAQAKNYGYSKDPHKPAVKKEGNKCLSSGSEGKIRRIDKAEERHTKSHYPYKRCGKGLNRLRCVINLRKKWCQAEHYQPCDNAAEDGKWYKLGVFISGSFKISGAQYLSDYYSRGIAHGNENHIKYIAQCVGYVHCRHHVKATDRIALGKKGYAQGPQHFIDKQRNSDSENMCSYVFWYAEAAVCSYNKRILFMISVCP